MSNKGTAIVLATAIYAGTKGQAVVDIELLEDRLYSAINASTLFSNDTAKADVYAQLAETLTASTTFEQATALIECALNNTAKALYGTH